MSLREMVLTHEDWQIALDAAVAEGRLRQYRDDEGKLYYDDDELEEWRNSPHGIEKLILEPAVRKGYLARGTRNGEVVYCLTAKGGGLPQ